MREILFRGKTLSYESQWVEGFYNHIPCGRFLCDEHCIQTIDEDGRIGQLFNVHESTVGQYTGLTDKNGKKIFEGDIIAYHAQGDIIVNRGAVVWDARDGRWAYQLRTMQPGFYMHKPEAVEVIGNIHDNPELLEVD